MNQSAPARCPHKNCPGELWLMFAPGLIVIRCYRCGRMVSCAGEVPEPRKWWDFHG